MGWHGLSHLGQSIKVYDSKNYSRGHFKKNQEQYKKTIHKD